MLRRNFLTPPDDGGDDIFELLREIQTLARLLRRFLRVDTGAPPLRYFGMIGNCHHTNIPKVTGINAIAEQVAFIISTRWPWLGPGVGEQNESNRLIEKRRKYIVTIPKLDKSHAEPNSMYENSTKCRYSVGHVHIDNQ